jgi:hypothetical protein
MVYACLTWEYEANSQLLKWQRLQKRPLRAIGNVDGRTPVRELNVAFETPHI